MLKNSLPKMVTTVPGPKASALLEKRKREVPVGVKTGSPVVIARGEGAMVEDVDGNIFLDWTGGVGVLNVGYSRPEVIAAVKEQSEKFFHMMMDVMTHEPYLDLAEKMNRIMPVKGGSCKTMFLNSGGECDATSVKIARAFTGRPNIVVFSGAYHGIDAKYDDSTEKGKQDTKRRGAGSFSEGVCKTVFPNMYRRPAGLSYEEGIEYYFHRLTEVFDEENPVDSCAAIIFEPVQGVGGLVPAPLAWVKKVRAFCDAHGILMICDEVQSAWSRTGRMFASDYYREAGAPPDIVVTAKSIAGGLPLASVSARSEIMDIMPPGTIGGTFCGNPIACAAALQVIDLMEKEDQPAKALAIEKKVMSAWKSWQEDIDIIGDCRGLGAMMGMELVHDREGKEPAPELVSKVIEKARNAGLLMMSAGTHRNVLRFLSPLCVTDAQTEEGLAILKRCLSEVYQEYK